MLLPGKCMSKLFNGLLLELLTSTYRWLYMLQLAMDANFQLESNYKVRLHKIRPWDLVGHTLWITCPTLLSTKTMSTKRR